MPIIAASGCSVVTPLVIRPHQSRKGAQLTSGPHQQSAHHTAAAARAMEAAWIPPSVPTASEAARIRPLVGGPVLGGAARRRATGWGWWPALGLPLPSCYLAQTSSLPGRVQPLQLYDA